MKRIVAALLAAVLVLGMTACGKKPGTEAPDPEPDTISDNYRSFYQVFVGSFADSNGDGFGDLRGLINNLDYLNDGNIHSTTSLGVQGIWLSPIFSSPSYHKYDATDYYTIDWRFGTHEDLKELLDKCHERNVKVILDLVVNHTSSSHPWFQRFKQARMEGNTADPYYDFYTCVTTAEKQGGIAYQKIAGVDGWYECNFSGDMPELNFDNPQVRQEMLALAQFYLEMGVDGFRFDAVKYIYYGDTDRTVEFWQWYMDELRRIKPDIYCVGECWSGETEIMEYYPAMNCFNFAMASAEGTAAAAARGSALSKYTSYLASYQKKVLEKNPDGMVMGFLSNHDMDRIAGAFVNENNMRMAANLYLLAPGSPMIYYGEELGLRGSRGGENTDANRRLAMPWGTDATPNHPVGATYPEEKQIQTTVADQWKDQNSLLNYYRRLLDIRHKYPAIARGVYESLSTGEKNFGGFRVSYEGKTLGILHNNGSQEISYDLAKLGFTKLCDSIGVAGAKLDGTVLTLGPQTSAVVE